MLANTGHIQTLICPPNNPKARYWVGGSRGPTPTRGRPAPRSAPRNVVGHWAEWVIARSGAEKPAPAELGDAAHPVLGGAPGTYVHMQA